MSNDKLVFGNAVLGLVLSPLKKVSSALIWEQHHTILNLDGIDQSNMAHAPRPMLSLVITDALRLPDAPFNPMFPFDPNAFLDRLRLTIYDHIQKRYKNARRHYVIEEELRVIATVENRKEKAQKQERKFYEYQTRKRKMRRGKQEDSDDDMGGDGDSGDDTGNNRFQPRLPTIPSYEQQGDYVSFTPHAWVTCLSSSVDPLVEGRVVQIAVSHHIVYEALVSFIEHIGPEGTVRCRGNAAYHVRFYKPPLASYLGFYFNNVDPSHVFYTYDPKRMEVDTNKTANMVHITDMQWWLVHLDNGKTGKKLSWTATKTKVFNFKDGRFVAKLATRLPVHHASNMNETEDGKRDAMLYVDVDGQVLTADELEQRNKTRQDELRQLHKEAANERKRKADEMLREDAIKAAEVLSKKQADGPSMVKKPRFSMEDRAKGNDTRRIDTIFSPMENDTPKE